jgi:hypothetical protein
VKSQLIRFLILATLLVSIHPHISTASAASRLRVAIYSWLFMRAAFNNWLTLP